jgi:hypothetical protein
MPKIAADKFCPRYAEVLTRTNAGAALISIQRSSLLKDFHRSTVIRWILKGRLPACRCGSRWFTTECLIRDFLAEMNRPKEPKGAKHINALEKLRAEGLLKN